MLKGNSLAELLIKREEDNRKEKLLLNYVPVYVLLPLFGIAAIDTRNAELKTIEAQLKHLKKDASIDGVMVDVWWGIVEYDAPKVYNWNAYKDLFNMIKPLGLKIYAIMSFHKSSQNNKTISLPKWILEIGEEKPDIYYTDRDLTRNDGCLSLGVDNKPIFPAEGHGGTRTAIQVFSDFMCEFRKEMDEFLETGLIVAIQVGLGPNGELCYPSSPLDGRWQYPGIGEFQCYDKYLMEDFRAEAEKEKENFRAEAKKERYQILDLLTKEFGTDDIEKKEKKIKEFGLYDSKPNETEFFKENGTYTRQEGKFFLKWYSTKLILHGDEILREANKIFAGLKVDLVAKISAVHWWYNHVSHAAELTAGYYNIGGRDGYRPIARMLSKRNCFLNFSCLEMKNPNDVYPYSAPHDLVKAVLSKAWREGVEVIGGNTSEIESAEGYNQVILNTRPNGFNPNGKPKLKVHSYMHLRLSEKIVYNNDMFKQFVRKMHADQEYCGDSEKYDHEVDSELAIFTSEEILAATKPSLSFKWEKETDMKVHG